MNTSFLHSVANKINKKQNSIFTYPVEKQKKYVEHFPEPKDGVERSYFQYRCQAKMQGALLQALLSFSALPLSIFYLLKLGKSSEKEESFDAVFFNEGKPFNIIPDELLGKYDKIKTISTVQGCLSKEDRRFLRKIFKRYPFSWLLWLKLILKISQYSHAITKYSPKAVIACTEFSFTASILTEYCHFRGVELVNVMHGEKLYYMRDSFVKFDEFYVWNQQYVDLLCSLRADKDQFRIAVPKSLRISIDDSVTVKYDYTYYLGEETIEELGRISENLSKLKDGGKEVSIRPHPRYSNVAEINKIFEFANVEDTKTVTIEQSLLQTKNAVSLYSTVLMQAYSSGINVVIDDVAAPQKFSKLEELGYVMLKVPHRKMSELVTETD
ncbi:MAG: hypothetical protein E7346_00470 [Clostridiales bacterium]|nr:hypothetical protein [Clostridiales bacterium]